MTWLPPPGRRTEEPIHERLSLDPATLRSWYRTLLIARGLDEQCERWHGSGRLRFYVPSAGNEVVDLATIGATRDGDWIFPSFRHMSIPLLRGATPREVLDAILGNANDPARGRQLPAQSGHPAHHVLPPSNARATHLVHAAGCALGMRLRGEHQLAVATCGPAAGSTPDFHTALDVARRTKAPVLFVATQSRGVAAANPMLVAHAKAHGIASARVDGTDIFAMVKASRDAASHARRGAGPSLIEAVRPKPSGNGDESAIDPIHRFRQYVIDIGMADADGISALEEEVATELEATAEEALKTPLPAQESRFGDVCLQEPPTVVAPRALDIAEGSRA